MTETHDDDRPGRGAILDESQRLTKAFVDLSTALARCADSQDHLQLVADWCAELIDIDAVAIVLTDDRGVRQAAFAPQGGAFASWVASHASDGPWHDVMSGGQVVLCDRLDAEAERWPGFVERAQAIGVAAAAAFPVRAATTAPIDGMLLMLRIEPRRWRTGEVEVGRALAALSATEVRRQGAFNAAVARAEELQSALDSRVVIEQAKGMLAQCLGVSVSAAFEIVRGYARRNNLRVATVAQALVERQIDWRAIVDDGRTGAPAT